jgi:hypothetical protein
MMKKLLMGATLAVAALTSTSLLADPADHRHGQGAPCTAAKCPAVTAEGQHFGAGRGGLQGRMQAMHEGRQGHGMRSSPRGGNMGEGCPMHNERKPT